MTSVDAHVRLRRHVAGHARRSGRTGRVPVMRRGVERGRQVTLRTHGVALGTQLQAVRVVAIRARHTRGVHPALQERAVVVHLVLHLAIGAVQPLGQERGTERHQERLARDMAIDTFGAPRVAGRTDLDLDPIGARRRTAQRDARGHLHRPLHIAPVPEGRRESHRSRRRRHGRPGRAGVGPGHVPGRRTVARLARHIGFGPRRLVRVRRPVVVLAQVRRVAGGTLRIPVLAERRPVQDVAVGHPLTGIQVIPALTTLRRRTRVPGHAQRLVAPVRKTNQVLLERVDPEDVRDVEVAQTPIRAVGSDDVPASLRPEAGRGAGVGERRVVEVAKHSGRRGLLHREVVMRALPSGGLRLMTACALGAPDVGRTVSHCRPNGRGGAATRTSRLVRAPASAGAHQRGHRGRDDGSPRHPPPLHAATTIRRPAAILPPGRPPARRPRG